MASVELLLALRRAVLTEIEKRQRQRGLEPGKTMREILYHRLDEMAARRRAHGDKVSRPTPAQLADLGNFLERLAARSKASED
jgi:hypothetical protein